MGNGKTKSLDDYVSDAVYDAQMEMAKESEQRIGSELERFISQDVLYVGVLLVSGILLLVNAQLRDTVSVGLLLAFYQLVLALTLVSYVYLRLIRWKRYNPGENKAIGLAGRWLVYCGGCLMVVLMAAMFILSTFSGINPPRESAGLLAGVGVLAGSAYFLKKNPPGEKAGAFALQMADGLAWVVVLGGIGALVLVDSAYGILLTLHWLAPQLVY